MRDEKRIELVDAGCNPADLIAFSSSTERVGNKVRTLGISSHRCCHRPPPPTAAHTQTPTTNFPPSTSQCHGRREKAPFYPLYNKLLYHQLAARLAAQQNGKIIIIKDNRAEQKGCRRRGMPPYDIHLERLFRKHKRGKYGELYTRTHRIGVAYQTSKRIPGFRDSIQQQTIDTSDIDRWL